MDTEFETPSGYCIYRDVVSYTDVCKEAETHAHGATFCSRPSVSVVKENSPAYYREVGFSAIPISKGFPEGAQRLRRSPSR